MGPKRGPVCRTDLKKPGTGKGLGSKKLKKMKYHLKEKRKGGGSSKHKGHYKKKEPIGKKERKGSEPDGTEMLHKEEGV